MFFFLFAHFGSQGFRFCAAAVIGILGYCAAAIGMATVGFCIAVRRRQGSTAASFLCRTVPVEGIYGSG
jgi:hypothetical protein